MANPYQQYQANSVQTASPEELTLMLYNGAIKFCNRAKDAMDKKDIPLTNYNIQKAQAIINEFRVTLDRNYPIAEEMDRLYEFVEHRLVEANIKKDPTKLDDALDIIKQFRDTWAEAIKSKRMA